jgi:hypothetical protein
MATDWGNDESSTAALRRIANIIDETADSTTDNESLQMIDLGIADHRTGSAVELDSASGGGTVTESLNVRGSPDEVRVIVQNATGNYSVDIDFDNTSVSLQDAASTDFEGTQTVYSNVTVDVSISDDSGASNTVDYDILLV